MNADTKVTAEMTNEQIVAAHGGDWRKSALRQIVESANRAEEILQAVNGATYACLFSEEARNHFLVKFAQLTVGYFGDEDYSSSEVEDIILHSIRETVLAHMVGMEHMEY